MKYHIFLTVVLVTLISKGNAQEVKKIYSKNKLESFEVLRSDQKIKHGEYEKRRYNGMIQVIGYFNHGQKDSVWRFFDTAGVVKQSYNYRSRRLVVYDSSDMPNDFKYHVLSTEDSSFDRPPVYIGGREMMYSDFTKGLRYPQKAIDERITGKVYISFKVNKDGTTSEFQVANGIGYGCDEEALKAVKQGAEGWLPGMYGGNPIDMQVTVYIGYRIES